MEQVIALAEAGSFHAAARRLGVTPSALGKAVAALEDRLGVRLFHRTTRRVALSEEGARALSGPIRLGGPVAYTRLRVLPVLLPFLARCPDIRLDLRLSDRVLDPLEERLDLVVRIGALPDSGMRARRLDAIRFGAFAAPSYLDCHPPIVEPDDLVGHRHLVFTTVDGRALPLAVERSGERRVIAATGTLASTDIDVLVDAARAGFGLFYGPTFLADEAVAAGGLVPVLPQWAVPHAPVHVLVPRPDRVPRRVAALADALLDGVARDVS